MRLASLLVVTATLINKISGQETCFSYDTVYGSKLEASVVDDIYLLWKYT